MEGDPGVAAGEGAAVVLNDARSLRESLAAERARGGRERGRGAFETPPALARLLVAEAYRGLALPGMPLPTLLDPACGTGVFLLEAFELISRQRPARPARELLATLHGLDVDPFAVSAARRVLIAAAMAHEARRGAGGKGLARAVRVRRADALSGRLRGEFDLVVGNPPWVSLAGKHGEGDRDREVVRRHGGDLYRPNLFELFVRATLRLLRQGGRQVFLVPDRLAHNRQFASLRREIVDTLALRRLIFGVTFPGVSADVLAYRLDRSAPSPRATVRVEDVSAPGVGPRRVRQRSFLARPGCPFWFVRGRGLTPLIDRLLAWPVRLKDAVESHTGFIARAGAVGAAGTRAVLKGEHVRAFAVMGEAYLREGPGVLVGGTQHRALLGAERKALVPKTGADLRCALDETGRWPEQSLYFLLAERPERLAIAVALLNSRIARMLYREVFVTNRASLPHLKKMDLDEMPWPRKGDIAISRGLKDAVRHARIEPVNRWIESALEVSAAEQKIIRGAKP